MIITLDDWKKYPNAIVDTKTTNESFLRMASLLKGMGIINHAFFLALLQPELQGVNPYSTNLTLDQKTKIALECYHNPFYFFREVAYLSGAADPIRFRLNRPILSLIWSFLCGIDYCILMTRQSGKSITADLIIIYLLDIYYRSSSLFLLTKDDLLRVANIERIKKTRKILPDWLIAITKADLDNTIEITNKTRGNRLITAVAQKSLDDAPKIGRGHTLSFCQVDEAPFCSNIQSSLPALISATDAARENNEKAGILYGNIYTTTAGKLDSKEGRYFYNFINSGMYWNEKLYDCTDKYDARQTVINNSVEGRCLIHGTFNHRQCGRSDDWLRKVLSTVSRTREEIERDYLLKWTSGAESSALSTQILEIIDKSEREPAWITVTKDKYFVKWYLPEGELTELLNTKSTVLALDSSNAIGRDANGLVMTNISNMAVIMTCTVSEANLHKYGIWIADILIKFPKIVFIIENKSSAQGILDAIAVKLTAVGRDPFKTIYNKIVDEHVLKVDEYKEICKPISVRPEQTYLKYKGQLGFHTTGSSRQFLYDTVLNGAMKAASHLVYDKTISSELKGLIIKNDRVDHLPGAHDDHVIALLLCWWFIKYTKNLQHYGINPLDCLSLVSDDGATLSPEEVEKRSRITQINSEIVDLKMKLIAAPNITESIKYERLLAHMVKEAQALGDNIISLDSIMRDVSANRVSKRDLRQSSAKFNQNRFVM